MYSEESRAKQLNYFAWFERTKSPTSNKHEKKETDFQWNKTALRPDDNCHYLIIESDENHQKVSCIDGMHIATVGSDMTFEETGPVVVTNWIEASTKMLTKSSQTNPQCSFMCLTSLLKFGVERQISLGSALSQCQHEESIRRMQLITAKRE